MMFSVMSTRHGPTELYPPSFSPLYSSWFPYPPQREERKGGPFAAWLHIVGGSRTTKAHVKESLCVCIQSSLWCPAITFIPHQAQERMKFSFVRSLTLVKQPISQKSIHTYTNNPFIKPTKLPNFKQTICFQSRSYQIQR